MQVYYIRIVQKGAVSMKLSALKRSLCLLISTGCLALTLGAGWYDDKPEENVNILGDVNCDGAVDSFDLLLLRQHISGSTGLTGDSLLNADIDYSGEPDEYDLKTLSDYLLSAGKMDTYTPVGSMRLGDSLIVKPESGSVPDTDFRQSQMKFSIGLLKQTAVETPQENLLISPVSVTSALAMTANGATGEVLSEMESVLGNGMPVSRLNEYIAGWENILESDEYCTAELANSVWFRQSGGFTLNVKDDFLSALGKYYGAEAFGTPYDSTTVSDINHWVSKNTRGVIPELYKPDHVFDPYLMMTLVNTTYFNGTWEEQYGGAWQRSFTQADGSTVKTDMLSSDEYLYIEGDGYKGFRKGYNGGFSFVGILPDSPDGSTSYLDDFISGLDPDELLASISSPTNVHSYEKPTELVTSMPKLKFDYDIKLNNALKAMGMPSAFEPGRNCFTGISEDLPMYIDYVIHKTAIEITESGTTAAAVTAVGVNAESAILDLQRIYVTLDRPYIFMIVDDTTDLPLFIGAVNQIP